ncbi:FxSxx-COOH system tetratricopeptide repeat protein [Sphaerisporangium sp. TRM90804]|uniref:FxSxx-COOH system tetratricopeptide repeat protein n=1 Tax=Sphaerisporangium sp. TRM90804 TaxID=3031113 RepID=UPI0024482099|nr:FxSxx-COOH system tetratricopeptide repeat protein [Sphaerisporangium sp. TRM90804]MDH2427496.1 FxSxx-COOH system tetratricopeptide repeat protein [Sphaerisporangium sp. TRM90804]
MPKRDKNFTGRVESLAHLRNQVSRGERRILLHALQGLSGVGKTHLAAEYAHRYRDDYDLVWWILADQPHLVPGMLAALAPHLDLPDAAAVGVRETAVAVLDALRRGEKYERWLLVFDNAGDPESLLDLLPDGPGDTLITSRDQAWEGVVNTLNVDVFRRHESIDFLHRRVRGITESEAQALAEALGDLPLALEQAGALISQSGMPPEEYLSLLKTQTTRLMDEGKPPNHFSVTATFRLSVTHLREVFPEAVVLLSCCAHFGPQPIPREVLSEGRSAVADPLAPILRDPLMFTKAVSTLGRYALVSADMPGRTLQVHRLVQALARDELTGEEGEEFQEAAHRLLAAATPRDPDSAVTWPRFAALLPHVESSEAVRCAVGETRFMIRSFVRYLYIAGDAPTALRYAQQALEHWSADPATAPADLAAMRRHLGVVLRDLGRYAEASDVNRRAVADAEALFGFESTETLRLTNSHGADLRAVGDFRGALSLDDDCVRRLREFLGEGHYNTLRAENNLAIDLALNSRFEEARELGLKVYQGERDIQGSDAHPLVLIVKNNLARAIRLCGDYEDGRILSEDCHGSSVNVMGADHPSTLLMLKDVAIAQRRVEGGTEEAVALAAEVLAAHERVRGHAHPDTLAAAVALVNALREAGRLEEAMSLATETVDVYPRVFGADHPYTLGCRVNVALLRRLSGDPQGAREADEATLAKLTSLLGPDHHYSLMCGANLASDLAALGETDLARLRGQETLDRMRSVLGRLHPLTLACAANLASDLASLGLEAESARLLAETLEEYARTLGPGHPRAVAAREGRRLPFDFDPPPI